MSFGPWYLILTLDVFHMLYSTSFVCTSFNLESLAKPLQCGTLLRNMAWKSTLLDADIFTAAEALRSRGLVVGSRQEGRRKKKEEEGRRKGQNLE